ncbi:MAG: replication associated protein [Microviridae sp. ctjyu33]|nr:MAG: replication associated protein [Microviridae sp. ctjyu33]
MPCYHPLQAYFSVRSDGKKDVKFSNALAKNFAAGIAMPEDSLQVPCGRCMGCRLERSRQWAVRMMHEAKLYEDNCFVTLTFDEKNLFEKCSNGSLDKKHVQDFMKALRYRFSDRKIRFFACGEYGDALFRPHYHLCLFNVDFADKVKWKKVNGFWYFNSDLLASCWTFGHSVISDLTFESAGYVARYCTKKVTGSVAKEHYGDRLPEFAQMSLKPGLGRGWLDRWGKTDCFAHDDVVVRGVQCKPPRYYDKVLESLDSARFELVKESRKARAQEKAGDSTFSRLAVREKCLEARIKNLIRRMEK